MSDWTQGEMFEVPKKYRPPKKPDKWPKWTTYKGKRTSCHDCIMAIARGQSTFVAEPSTQVRADEAGTAFYCTTHGNLRKAKDREDGLIE